MYELAQIIQDAGSNDFSRLSHWLNAGETTPEILGKILHEAASYDSVENVERLLEAGANPYYEDEKGRTAFNRAASNGLHALDFLTEKAFQDTQKPKEQRQWPDYDLDTPSGYYGSTLITYAAKVSSVGLVQEMIDASADITIINGSGWTLLHCAAVMPERTNVLPVLVKAFKDQGHADLIGYLSTHIYETEYNGHKVVFGTNLTAAELCQARIDQDPDCPAELSRYLPSLGS